MVKLLLVLFVAGVCVNVSVGGFWRLAFFERAHASLERNVAHYARLLAAEIGSPPDTAAARAIAERYSLRIRYAGPGGAWESGSGPAFPEVRARGDAFHEVPGEPGVRTGWGRRRFFVQVPAGAGVVTFAAGFDPLEGRGWSLAFLILLLSLCLALAFLAIRRLLSPLRFLNEGVERLGRGELGYQVPVRSRDELGDLARSFNSMSADLGELIRSREQLLLDVSHELRTPLTRIKLALEMAPDGMAKESIGDDLREMEAMIAEILESARLDSANGGLQLEDVDLEALVEEAIGNVSLREPGAMRAGPPIPGGAPVRADKARVRKVLANILDNAVKYSRGSGRPVEVRLESGPEGAVVRVEDHGPGIPEAELPKIFEPFYRVDRSRSRDTGGYGLGLSLCKRIMEAHGGSISIASREGEGAEVSLAFPPPRDSRPNNASGR